MLLYLVEHLRPDMANVVKALSTVSDETYKAAVEKMHQVNKYVLDKYDLWLKLSQMKTTIAGFICYGK